MSAHFQRGLILYQQQRYQDAVAEFQKHLAEPSDHSLTHAMMSHCFTALGRFEESAAQAELAISAAPESSMGFHALAVCHAKRRRFREAQREIREAIRLDAEEPEYFALLAAIQLERFKFVDANESCERGLALDPDHPGCHHMRNLAAIMQGRGDGKATSSIALEPDECAAHLVEGASKLYAADSRAAQGFFREALRLNPNNESARRGYVECLKRRSWFYSLLSRELVPKSRGQIIFYWLAIPFGLFCCEVLLQIVQLTKTFDIQFFIALAVLAVVMILMYLGSAIFNLTLWIDKTSRLALSKEESRGAMALAFVIVLTVILFAAGILTSELIFIYAAIRAWLTTIAFATFIRNWRKLTAFPWLAVSVCIAIHTAMDLVRAVGCLEWISKDSVEALANVDKVAIVQLFTFIAIFMTIGWPFLCAIPGAFRRLHVQQQAANRNEGY